ncbi:hypothetical protein GOV08_02585 [Candidatus Woesearchaeota archaeon]|nr:hypothetical protein [Candidatus Woesearchaeota archaeon]
MKFIRYISAKMASNHDEGLIFPNYESHYLETFRYMGTPLLDPVGEFLDKFRNLITIRPSSESDIDESQYHLDNNPFDNRGC